MFQGEIENRQRQTVKKYFHQNYNEFTKTHDN